MREHLDPTERDHADHEDRLLADLFCQHLDHPHTARERALAHSPGMAGRLAAVIAVYHAHTRHDPEGPS